MSFAEQTIKHIKETRATERMKNTLQYNEQVRTSWTPIWVRNAARSYKEVERRYETMDCDLRNAPKLNGAPVLVLGSGPSLDDVLPLLGKWEGKISCSTSHLPLLAAMDIEPDYVWLIDADPAMIHLTARLPKHWNKFTFVTHPQVPREILEHMPEGRTFFFRMFDPGDKFATDYLPLVYGWMNEKTGWHIGSYILNSGNIVNAQIPGLLALGAGPMFLCGYDLGYPEKDGKVQWRSSYAEWKDDKWEVLPPPPLPTQEVRPIKYEKGNNGVLADELCYFYKFSFLILLGLGNVPVLSCSRGIVSEIPYVSAETVVANQGKGFEHLLLSAQDAYRIAQAYLKERGLFIIKTDWSVETVNILTLKGLARPRFLIRFWWMNSRPWKWLGGKGWIPRMVKKKFKAEGKIARYA